MGVSYLPHYLEDAVVEDVTLDMWFRETEKPQKDQIVPVGY